MLLSNCVFLFSRPKLSLVYAHILKNCSLYMLIKTMPVKKKCSYDKVNYYYFIIVSSNVIISPYQRNTIQTLLFIDTVVTCRRFGNLTIKHQSVIQIRY